MSQDIFQQVLQQSSKAFDQKISLMAGSLTFELAVQDEQAVGQIFDHYPLAQLVQNRAADYQVKWVNSQTYGFKAHEWREEVDSFYPLPGQQVFLKPNFVAICEGKQITLIASYEISDGFLDFVQWVAALRTA